MGSTVQAMRMLLHRLLNKYILSGSEDSSQDRRGTAEQKIGLSRMRNLSKYLIASAQHVQNHSAAWLKLMIQLLWRWRNCCVRLSSGASDTYHSVSALRQRCAQR